MNQYPYPPNQPSQSNPNDPTIPGQFYPIVPPAPGVRHKRLWRWYRAQRKRTQWGLGCGIITAAFFLCICSAAFAATPGAGQSQTASHPTPTATATTIALVATTQPTTTPTPTPTPQPTPKPKPTPTPNLCPNAVSGNPWCYDFSPGNLIYSPPAGFCGYFNCISSFWSGSGFVNECNDGTYSKSGGHRGDCSHHGGEQQPLYSH